MGRKPLPPEERYANRANSKRLYQVKWRAAHPDAARQYYQKKKYGLKTEEREAFLSAQGSKCLLCEIPFDVVHKPHVLYENETQKILGLICTSCRQKQSHAARRQL